MIDDNFFYDGFTEEAVNDFIEWSDSVNDTVNRADTELAKENAARKRKEFYREIESVKIKDIEVAIKETGDNKRKTLLERVKQEVQNARRVMYERKAPDIITNLFGLTDSRYSYNEYEYWAEAEIDDLIFSEQAIDEIKIGKDNFQNIAYGTNTNSIELAIERAEEAGNIEKKQRLINIRDKIERVRASATIYGHRYQPGKEHSVERKPDERILGMIDRMFEELEQEASAGFVLNSGIYVYLTNAKDKNDLLKRLEVVNSKLEEYEKAKSEGSIDYIKRGIGEAVQDFESGDILGIDKEVEER